MEEYDQAQFNLVASNFVGFRTIGKSEKLSGLLTNINGREGSNVGSNLSGPTNLISDLFWQNKPIMGIILSA